MVAVTSSGLATKSTNVPICPGRRPSGGTNSTGVSLSCSGARSSGVPGFAANAASTAEPRYRRSRPTTNTSTPMSPRISSSIPPEMPAVAGVARKAEPTLNRSSRIGVGGGTAPLGIPTVTVMP